MKQTVERRNDLVVSVLEGELTLSDVKELYAIFEKIVEQLNAEKLPIKLVVDCRKLVKINFDAFSVIKQIMTSTKVFRSAIVGGSYAVKKMMRLIMTFLGTSEESKFFDTMEEATAWISM